MEPSEKLRIDKIGFKTIVFKQIERVNEAISMGKDEFANAVSCLESLVFPKADIMFKRRMTQINAMYKKTVEDPPGSFYNNGIISNYMIAQFTLDIMHMKYKEIMNLLERKGLNDI